MASMRFFFDLVVGLRERAVEKHFRSRATGSGLVDLPQHGIYIYAQGGEALVYPRGDRSGLFLNILGEFLIELAVQIGNVFMTWRKVEGWKSDWRDKCR